MSCLTNGGPPKILWRMEFSHLRLKKKKAHSLSAYFFLLSPLFLREGETKPSLYSPQRGSFSSEAVGGRPGREDEGGGEGEESLWLLHAIG